MASGPGEWRKVARGFLPAMRRWRAAFHREPELSNSERRTQAKVRAALKALGIPTTTYPGSTGVIGLLGADRPGPVVALRADMDGLPVAEATGLSFRSRFPGRMHACGHDVHMACLLGAAAMLAANPDSLRGPVKLIFQPAEEEGETGGALPLLRLGVFRKPRVDFVVGQHVTPELPVGTIGWKKGPVYAAADRFVVRVVGRGSHAAYPHLGRDPIVVASEIVLGMQALVSRLRDPVDPAVISVGMVHGGTRHNILPDEVTLEGTVRTLRAETRTEMERAIRGRVRHLAESLGARAEVEYFRGYPATVNSPLATEIVVDGLTREFGERSLRELDEPAMGAEDFSRYLERVPGTFLKLGTGRAGESEGLHTARFAPPDEVLPVGAAALVVSSLALQRSSP
ncbi:MAG TPA: M20 family metallopeptidase [Thermoplasmata archaeon]|nr:M20 family metallopeptidase [Thermoplasmata archaeon]